MGNVFNRTIILCKESMGDGRTRIRRIPWDLISITGIDGFFVSPMPISTGFERQVATAAYLPDVSDMLIESDSDKEIIDEIINTIYFSSEEEFYASFEGVFGFYKSSPKEVFGG